MKTLLTILLTLILGTISHAGIAGWLTAKSRDWQFIQQTGGLHIAAPIERQGKQILPVDYWPEGNSGLAVRKVDLQKEGDQLVIRIITQLAEKGSDTARVHYVDLSGIPPGSYRVYYETAGDPAKLLGRFEIR